MADPGGRPGTVQTWGPDQAATRVAVLAVHGRGQNPGVMEEYSSHFGVQGVTFVAPAAPGDSWYPFAFLEPIALNAEGLQAGLNTVDECLTRLLAGRPAGGKVVVWGFSQGACLLSHHLLTRRPAVDGAILFTGGYVGDQKLDLAAGSELLGLPVVVRSIENDPFVPPLRVAETVTLLRRLGADVDVRIDPGHEHIITGEAYAAAARLLTRLGVPSGQAAE